MNHSFQEMFDFFAAPYKQDITLSRSSVRTRRWHAPAPAIVAHRPPTTIVYEAGGLNTDDVSA
jgi:hypothetical protein